MIVVDTSAWIEYMRQTESWVDLKLTEAIEQQREIAITDVVLMELMAGAVDIQHAFELKRLMYKWTFFSSRSPSNYEHASHIYRACRENGLKLRNLTDCLIASVAIGQDAAVLTSDRDFETIAEHSLLKLHK